LSTPPHTKIVNKVARQALKPVGVKQKGRSRIWLDDNGWWITVVEFQPSARAQGTFLNVGVNFQWYPKDHLSFDIGYREAGFIEYESDEQFETEALELAEQAKTKVLELREKMSDPQSAKQWVIASYRDHQPTLWSVFHQGMSCVLAHETDAAIVYFNQVISDPHDTKWALELKQFTAELVALIESGEETFKFIDEIVNESRQLKKLDSTSTTYCFPETLVSSSEKTRT